jgi:hypothetical protein
VARIRTYALDTALSIDDKFLGTNDSGSTKNFNVEDIIDFINSSGRLEGNVAARFTYKLHNTSPVSGSIGFEVDKLATQSFTGLTELMISKRNKLGTDYTNLYNSLSGTTILIQKATDVSTFAIFNVTSVGDNETYADFFDLTISHQKSQGNLQEDQDYFVSIIGLTKSIDKHHTFVQNSASASWSITHNLGKKPSVTIVDSADTLLHGQVDYVDNDNLTITLSAPTSGKAYLN